MISVLDKLRERQIENLIDGVLSLHRAAIYSSIDSSLTLPGELDKIIKDLERILNDER